MPRPVARWFLNGSRKVVILFWKGCILNTGNAWRNSLVVGLLALLVLLAGSLCLRQHEFAQPKGAQDMEATYHVLLTVTAMNENPLPSHWYLPIISLAGEQNKHIPWGATIATKAGDYVYTSFTPPGFLAPYFFFKVVGWQPTPTHLVYFNFLLGSASVAILFFLLAALLRFNGYAPRPAVCAAVLGCTVAIFSREALQSQGLVYWNQCLYQLILVVSFWLLFHCVTAGQEKQRKLCSILLVIAAFLGPWTEWTGYVFNAGAIVLLWRHESAQLRKLARYLLWATVIAGLLTLLHYGLLAGFLPAMKAFVKRFLSRSTASGSLVELLQGYGLSYGVFLLLVFLAPALAYFRKDSSAAAHEKSLTLACFVVACIPVFENIVMLQHASQFSYDRLKFVFPAAMILAFTYVRLPKWPRLAFVALVLVACVHGYKSYRADMNTYAPWADADAANIQLAKQIGGKLDLNCAVLSTNMAVRGYADLLFHRGIFEHKTVADSVPLMASRHACAAVFLDGTELFPDLPRYTSATLTFKDGSTQVLRVLPANKPG